MANLTNIQADAAMLLGASGYTVLGFIYGFCNLLIGLSVLKYGALRQFNQYVLLMALAFSDAGTLFGFCTAGVYRLWLVATNRLDTLLTPAECLMKPHVILWLTAYPFSSLMLVILSIDRLFLVSFPSFYILSLPSPRYSHFLVFTGLGFISVLALLGVTSVYIMPPVPSLNAICYMPLSDSNPHLITQLFVYYFERASFLALTSLVIFAAVPIVRRFRTNNVDSEEQERHNRMTKTVAVSCLCTLFLYSIPNRLGYMAFNEGYRLMARLFWLLSMTNPFCNIIIYQMRHYEMKMALQALLQWKTMPDSLSLWPKPNQAPPALKRGRAFKMTNHRANIVLDAEDLHIDNIDEGE